MVQTKEFDILKPDYYDKFTCIGSDCEDNCCYGWQIIIDKNTYNKYRNVKSKVFSEKRERVISRIKGAKTDDFNYARFVLTDKGLCPFQAENGLCEIHRDLGEEYLSRTCRIYPRNRKCMINDLSELSISMSCPEAVRVALFNEAGIDFIAQSQQMKVNEPLMQGAIYPQPGEIPTQYIRYGWEMREAAIAIMQMRDCPVAYRLVIIAMMLDEVVKLHDEEKYEDIPGILEYYATGSYGEEFIAGLNAIEHNDEIQMRMSSLLYFTIQSRSSHQRNSIFRSLVECFEKNTLSQKADLSETIKSVEFFSYIKHVSEKHWSGFLSQWEYVLENYFVNYMFSELFPLTYHKDGVNPYHHSFILAEQYAILRMLLCGSFNESEGFTKEYLVRTIVQVAELNQHSEKPLKIVQSYRAVGIDSPAHLFYFLL